MCIISLPFASASPPAEHPPEIAAPRAIPAKQDVPSVKTAPTPQVTAPAIVEAAVHPTANPADVPILHPFSSQAITKYGNITTIKH